jgi:hypothetical protein
MKPNMKEVDEVKEDEDVMENNRIKISSILSTDYEA